MESAFKNVSKFGFVTPDKILKGKKNALYLFISLKPM